MPDTTPRDRSPTSEPLPAPDKPPSRLEADPALATSQRLQLVADAVGLGMAEVDLATQRVFFDARACRNHGLPFPLQLYTTQEWLDQVHEDDQPAALQTLSQATTQTQQCCYRFRLPGGRVRWLELLLQAELGEDGQPRRLLGTCRDVTDFHENTLLRQAKDAAEHANQAKTDFLSRVSHEFRTPLNAILGFTQLMALDVDNPLSAEQQARLAHVQGAGQHLLSLVNDILELARIERADFKLPRRIVPVGEVLNQCLAALQAPAARIGVSLPATCHTPLLALGDARSLEQVLLNLLSNALHYNRPAGKAWVSTEQVDGLVRIAVHDTGLGLSEAQCLQLFQPFNRPHRTLPAVESSGLGLRISRQLVELMGGRLEVSSTPGVGSVFSVVLPAAPNGVS